ncbi:hypothetical protein CYY_007102 [Polysphondylium violaceum]|uniref:CENP-V/GFA domain-containing protein n=1 Tax=Polysphondylium violaceum TaxID=133409 RepID=A0A8J4UY86_9MYCE|nr:hypothetical protein CYY_007102 [Polysphondylium violaceum]
MTDKEIITHTGGCHCGKIRIEFDAPSNLQTIGCNCSICAKKGFIHFVVPKSKLRLVKGEFGVDISTYTFNTGVAQHYFCSTCGITPFYIPRSNPDGYSINVRCLDNFNPEQFANLEYFDGRNWEKHAHTLAHLSKE